MQINRNEDGEENGAGQFGGQRDFDCALFDRAAAPHHKPELPHDDFRRAHYDHRSCYYDVRAPFKSRIPAIITVPPVFGNKASGGSEEGDNAG